MKILFVTAELAPLAKVGGLGDVSFALPKALKQHGHDVRIVLPCYQRLYEAGLQTRRVTGKIDVRLGFRRLTFETLETTFPGSDVPVYLVHCPQLYDRQNLYTNDFDEHVRYGLLNWAAPLIAQHLGFKPDILHVNDWQTGLLPMMLKRNFGWDRLFADTKSVITIHNIGHQGTFGSASIAELGLANEHDAFHQEHLKQGRFSFLETGLLWSNVITTVSPTYAREIMTPDHGVGLDGILRHRADVVRGILNGIDDVEWNPATDRHLTVHYTADDKSGKVENKKQLLERMKLPYRERTPVIGIVSRLVWQKGFDLCFEAIPALLNQRDVQLVVLGSGEAKYEQFFAGLARAAPHLVAYDRGFNDPLAHLIEAGADMFLMPSRYEPCGLNQLYSCAYGTPPIVHRTGGLSDTVHNWHPYTGEGNGFIFDHFDVRGLKWALGFAVDSYQNQKGWELLMDNAMREHWGWKERVAEYEQLYRALNPRAA